MEEEIKDVMARLTAIKHFIRSIEHMDAFDVKDEHAIEYAIGCIKHYKGYCESVTNKFSRS